MKAPFSLSEATYRQEAAEEAPRAPCAMAAARTVASKRHCSIEVVCRAKAAGGIWTRDLMGRFFTDVFHQGCRFELTDYIAELACCTTTCERRKCANPLNGYVYHKKKGGKLGNNQAVFISLAGGSHSKLCVFKFFTGIMVKGFGRDLKETAYVTMFIVMMSVRDSLIENMKVKA